MLGNVETQNYVKSPVENWKDISICWCLISLSSCIKWAGWSSDIILNQTGWKVNLLRMWGSQSACWSQALSQLLNVSKLIKFGSFAWGESPGPCCGIPLMQKIELSCTELCGWTLSDVLWNSFCISPHWNIPLLPVSTRKVIRKCN